ncbi:hypothetical protein O181_020311 [Austropuccinia psidii MF-1]|uniref:Integrase catalytic domain-containing protein n=1 Tax=Austropuccinia psidii MF-1 TaxID=1389203 RepID=A0A9Q3GUP9_9BASI|nr:hypothetical protein [Austropuccinia psidii MF-1]
MAILIPAHSEINALDLSHIIMSDFVSNNGLSISILSDRGSLFVPSFWTQSCQQLKISRDISTSFYPETDGQKEGKSDSRNVSSDVCQLPSRFLAHLAPSD